VREEFFEELEAKLNVLAEQDLYRSLKTYSGVDFGSNDYLGFAHDEELRQKLSNSLSTVALSSASSRLLSGNHREHLLAEQCFAEFLGVESALLFNSGYDANFALLTTLPSRHDLILYDERSHASLYEGVHSSHATSIRFEHNSPEHLEASIERALKKFKHRQIFIIIESVYSMDGDITPLQVIKEISDKYSAILIVDEAHGTGVVGNGGRGLTSCTINRSPDVITIHTCGKALGAAGAIVAGSRAITQYLVNKARPFIYTTALPPIVPLQIVNSVNKLKAVGDELVAELLDRSQFVRSALRSALKKWIVPEGITPIIPIIIGDEGAALKASFVLEDEGFVVPAIRPPTVPAGTSRLRLNISLRHKKEELEKVVEAIIKVEQTV